MSTPTALVDYFQVQLYSPKVFEAFRRTRLLVPLGDIAEIITVQQRDLCPLPGLPRGVTGVLNLRGQLIWTMDLRLLNESWAGSARRNLQAKLTLVLVASEQGQIACLVDRLLGIMNCHLEQCQPARSPFSSAYAFCENELALENGDTGLLLDTPQLFKHLRYGP